jgi:6-phosphofructokinase 1
MKIEILGKAEIPSPLRRTIVDGIEIPEHILIGDPGSANCTNYRFEVAGPRPYIYFDPAQVRAGIVTCGGLCPGLNNVIRSLFLELYYSYGVRHILGFRGGYQGLDPAVGAPPIPLSTEIVGKIHKEGGTILQTSRGPVDIQRAVDNLIQLGVNMLFTIGGDGTQRGSKALYDEARRRGYTLAVVGVPKTVDNDVPFVSRTFGYLTAVQEAARVLDRAHTEVKSVHNGIALVKIMGRHAGFIAAGATMACQDVNFTLVPEIPFRLEGTNGFLSVLERRIRERRHAVVVVAEGAGQDLLQNAGTEHDASGNVKLADIGPYLRDRIEVHFESVGLPVVMRYFDPSYIVRSSPANSEDAYLCDRFARNAVHAAMAGKTGLVIGLLHDRFVHVPIDLLTSRKKRLDPNSQLWSAVLSSTGQPEKFE